MKEKEIERLREQIVHAYETQQLQKLNLEEKEFRHWFNFKLIPIDLIIPADWNYKQEDKETQEKLTANLKRLQQVENAHVRQLDSGRFEMINGMHRLKALRQLDKKFVYCYDHGPVSFEEAARRAIETNETKFKADRLQLSELLEKIAGTIEPENLSETMPFNDDEMQEMREMANIDWPEADTGEGDADSDTDLDTDPTKKTVKLVVPTEVYDRWKEWQARVNNLLGYDGDWKAFEFAIEEALQIPEDQLENTA